MNKIKLISVALVCALGLAVTSCVDDGESASVENVRNAKAALLNAKAQVEAANAAAVKIKSEAEAALISAEAAIKQALAQQEQAVADSITKTIELKIANAILELQKLNNQKKDDYINSLYANYRTYVEEVNTRTINLLGWKRDLAKLEYNNQHFDVMVANAVNFYNLDIAESEAAIAAYEALKEQGTVDQETLKQMISDAYANYMALDAEAEQLNDARAVAEQKEEKLLSEYKNTAYMAAALTPDFAGAVVVKNRQKQEQYQVAYQPPYNGQPEANAQYSYVSGKSIPVIVSVDMNVVKNVIKDADAELADAVKDFNDYKLNLDTLVKKEDAAFIGYDTVTIAANKATAKQKYIDAKNLADAARTTFYGDQSASTGSNAQLGKSGIRIMAEQKNKDLKEKQKALEAGDNTNALATLQNADDEWIAAQKAYEIKNGAVIYAEQYYNTLTTVVSGVNWDTLIADELRAIAAAKQAIENLTVSIGSHGGTSWWITNPTKAELDGLVAMANKEIALLEGEIVKAQAKADYYKKQIETSVAE